MTNLIYAYVGDENLVNTFISSYSYFNKLHVRL